MPSDHQVDAPKKASRPPSLAGGAPTPAARGGGPVCVPGPRRDSIRAFFPGLLGGERFSRWTANGTAVPSCPRSAFPLQTEGRCVGAVPSRGQRRTAARRASKRRWPCLWTVLGTSLGTLLTTRVSLWTSRPPLGTSVGTQRQGLLMTCPIGTNWLWNKKTFGALAEGSRTDRTSRPDPGMDQR